MLISTRIYFDKQTREIQYLTAHPMIKVSNWTMRSTPTSTSYVMISSAVPTSTSVALQPPSPHPPALTQHHRSYRQHDDRAAHNRHATRLPPHDRPLPQKHPQTNLPLPNPLPTPHLHPTRPHRRRAQTPVLQPTRAQMGSFGLHRHRQ